MEIRNSENVTDQLLHDYHGPIWILNVWELNMWVCFKECF